MPAPETLATFFLAAVLLAVAPGPDNLFVLTQSALRGRAAGLVVVLGLCSGLLVHTLAVIVGVAAILAASPVAFTMLKGSAPLTCSISPGTPKNNQGLSLFAPSPSPSHQGRGA